VRHIRFTPRARRDVVEIWEYIARENPDAADRVIAAIEEAARLLAELPGIGHALFAHRVAPGVAPALLEVADGVDESVERRRRDDQRDAALHLLHRSGHRSGSRAHEFALPTSRGRITTRRSRTSEQVSG
jgi:plasmid stabilization system protein ParE